MHDDPTSSAGAPAPRRPSLPPDLMLRAMSGIVLAVVTFALVALGVMTFTAFIVAVCLVISWEWGSIVRGNGMDAQFVVHAGCAAGAAVLAGLGLAGLGLAVVAAGAIIVGLLDFGQRPLLSAAGVLYTGLPAVALLWLRADEPNGLLAVLFILATVAANDVFAYFTGRTVGGPRLARRISPNKTWAGLVGGVSASAITGAAFAYFAAGPLAELVLTGTAFGCVAQAGDLAESALKRSFGVKDAGAILPGHGGFMDRVDGLIAVVIVAALMALATGPRAPATALLYGV